jgi:hypothetical protein
MTSTFAKSVPAPFVVERSAESLAFEAHWRNLPKTGLVPERVQFKPEKAARFLRNLVLVEAPDADATRVNIRLAGSGVQERMHRDITGHDYLDFLPKPYHDGALASAKLMLSYPCGLWQVMAVHYERGYSQNVEITAFPLIAGEGSAPLLVIVMIPVAGLVKAHPSPGKVMVADTASTFEFIDIGAGVPVWPIPPQA